MNLGVLIMAFKIRAESKAVTGPRSGLNGVNGPLWAESSKAVKG